ncbi:MAG: FTR1 family protein [Patescibacteria group bacterium]|nr:FTR1 family protein [Patescibacteria group bacterium]MDE2588923.1 FTR1 family protein [Patescibacteria group bacterium]
MLATAIIAFREFLEAFLLIGIFVGVDHKLKLGKGKEILSAAFLGTIFSLVLPIIVFFLTNKIRTIITERTTDIIEGYLLTFSGLFIAYVVFSLHAFLKDHSIKKISRAKQKLEEEAFDVSLFFTIVFFICREGFEVALLIAAVSVFSVFQSNLVGLLIGFTAAFIIGLATYCTYIKFSIKHIFRYTEYAIILIGAAMLKNGISLLLENYLHINLEKFLALPLQFLPSDNTIAGHLLKNLTGIQPNLSIIQVAVMGAYIFLISFFFMVKRPVEKPSRKISGK